MPSTEEDTTEKTKGRAEAKAKQIYDAGFQLAADHQRARATGAKFCFYRNLTDIISGLLQFCCVDSVLSPLSYASLDLGSAFGNTFKDSMNMNITYTPRRALKAGQNGPESSVYRPFHCWKIERHWAAHCHVC